MRPIIKLLPIALLALTVALPAQEAPVKEKKLSPLEQAIEKAMATSPEVRLAEAEVQKALANLAIVKAEVAEKVLANDRAQRLRELEIQSAYSNLERVKKLYEAGNVDRTVFQEAENRVMEAQMERDHMKLRQQLISLDPGTYGLVINEARPMNWQIREQKPAAVDPVEQPKKVSLDDPEYANVRSLLARHIKLPTTSYSSDTLFETLRSTSNLGFLLDNSLNNYFSLDDMKIQLTIEGPQTVGDYLLAISDQTGFGFVIRPYGIFVTVKQNAVRYGVPSIPAADPLRRR